MNIPKEASIQEVLKLLEKEKGITYPEYFYQDFPGYDSFEEMGKYYQYSSQALTYCTYLDRFFDPFVQRESEFIDENQKFVNVDGFVEAIYTYTTATMHAVYNDFWKGSISAIEKETLLGILAVHAKSTEYWIKDYIKKVNTATKQKELPYLWVVGMMNAMCKADTYTFNDCMQPLYEAKEKYPGVWTNDGAIKAMCQDRASAASLSSALYYYERPTPYLCWGCQ